MTDIEIAQVVFGVLGMVFGFLIGWITGYLQRGKDK